MEDKYELKLNILFYNLIWLDKYREELLRTRDNPSPWGVTDLPWGGAAHPPGMYGTRKK